MACPNYCVAFNWFAIPVLFVCIHIRTPAYDKNFACLTLGYHETIYLSLIQIAIINLQGAPCAYFCPIVLILKKIGICQPIKLIRQVLKRQVNTILYHIEITLEK